jgi:hypothetical protein
MIQKGEITTNFRKWKKDEGDECPTLKLPEERAFTPTKRNSRAGRDGGNGSSPKPIEDDSVDKGVLLGAIFPMCENLMNLENELRTGSQQLSSNTLTSVKESVVQLCQTCKIGIFESVEELVQKMKPNQTASTPEKTDRSEIVNALKNSLEELAKTSDGQLNIMKNPTPSTLKKAFQLETGPTVPDECIAVTVSSEMALWEAKYKMGDRKKEEWVKSFLDIMEESENSGWSNSASDRLELNKKPKRDKKQTIVFLTTEAMERLGDNENGDQSPIPVKQLDYNNVDKSETDIVGGSVKNDNINKDKKGEEESR